MCVNGMVNHLKMKNYSEKIGFLKDFFSGAVFCRCHVFECLCLRAFQCAHTCVHACCLSTAAQ